MLPDNSLSSIPAPGAYLPPDDQTPPALTDYELGGVAINDASQGLRVKVWTLFVDHEDVKLQPAGGGAVTLFSATGISDIALAFDQNMHPAVAYLQAGELKLRWYDATLGQTVTSSFGAARSPKLSLDDKRESATRAGRSDVVLAYLRGGGLYYRQQRDRFTIERLLTGGIGQEALLRSMGMSRRGRLQFEVR